MNIVLFGKMELVVLGRMDIDWYRRLEMVWFGRIKMDWKNRNGFGLEEWKWIGLEEWNWFCWEEWKLIILEEWKWFGLNWKLDFRIITKYLDNKHFMIKIFFFLDKTLNSYRFISKIVGLYDLKKKKKKISRNLENSTVCNSIDNWIYV